MPIDSIDLFFGPVPVTPASRLVRKKADPRAGRIEVDLNALVDRHGSNEGEVQWRKYKTGVKALGQWRTDLFVAQYNAGAGNARLRASLPKIWAHLSDPEASDAHNDRQLSIAEAHAALRRLVELGSDWFGVELNLREAVPNRLDIYFQWEVESVASVLRCMDVATPARDRFDLTRNPRGGHTAYWDKTKPRVLRAYDKGAETIEKLGESQYGLDRLLRIELQSRVPKENLVHHEDGYRAPSLQRLYADAIAPLTGTLHELPLPRVQGGVSAFLDQDDEKLPASLLDRLGLLYTLDHPDAWQLVKQRKSASSYYRYRAAARRAAQLLRPAELLLPEHAFGDPRASLWVDDPWQEFAA